MWHKQPLFFFLCCQLLTLTGLIAPFTPLNAQQSNHPFYLGLMTGYGATTWRGLVPSKENQNGATIIATPKNVTEGGVPWGFFAGYELIPTFALEASYMRYPNAAVHFDDMSLMTFEYGITKLLTHTETAALSAKVMLFIPHTYLRAFSSAGVAGIHRWDELTDCWRPSPTFAVGLNYPLSEHFLGEFALSYTSGYGESEINPAIHFVPFLYTATFKLAYQL